MKRIIILLLIFLCSCACQITPEPDYRMSGRDKEEISRKEFWIGMSREEAEARMGRPDYINKTGGSWGVHEQWVYRNHFVYDKFRGKSSSSIFLPTVYLNFENGRLTSYQGN